MKDRVLVSTAADETFEYRERRRRRMTRVTRVRIGHGEGLSFRSWVLTVTLSENRIQNRGA